MQYNLSIHIYIHSALHIIKSLLFSGPPLRQLPREWPKEAPVPWNFTPQQSGKDCIIQRKNSRKPWYLYTNKNALCLFDTLLCHGP